MHSAFTCRRNLGSVEYVGTTRIFSVDTMDLSVGNMLGLLMVFGLLWSSSDAQGAVSTSHRLNSEVPADAWRYNEFPNPRTEPGKCGRQKSSWICDPDKLLEEKHADELDLLISSIRRVSSCPCSMRSCATSGQAGYTVSIAVMEKMYRMTHDLSSLVTDARNFAFGLEKEKWRFDRCDEDILILFSLRDNIIFAVTGLKAREKISDETLHEVVMDSMQFFQHNPYMGLKHMIYAIRHAVTNKLHVYRGEKRHLSGVYSYRIRQRPRAAGSRPRGEGRIVGSYSSSATREVHGLQGLVIGAAALVLLLRR